MDSDRLTTLRTELEALLAATPPDVARVVADYAAFERECPRLSLELDTQAKAAAVLEEAGMEPLALEAWRKVLEQIHCPEPLRQTAVLHMGRIYARHAATYERLRKVLTPLTRVQPATEESREALQLLDALEHFDRALIPGVAAGAEDSVPDDGSLYTIIAQSSLQISIPTAGRIISAELHQTLADVTSALRQFSGYLAGGLERDRAVSVGHALQADGIPVVLLPEREILQFPPVEEVRDVRIAPDGYVFEANGAQTLVSPQSFLLLFAGYLREKKASVPPTSMVDGMTFGRYGPYYSTSNIPTPFRQEEATRWTGLADLFTLNPPRRLRFKEKTLKLDALNLGTDKDRHRNYIRLLKAMAYSAPRLPLNDGLSALFLDEPAEQTEFLSETAFDRAAQWLVQLEYVCRRRGHDGLPGSAP